MSDKKNVHISFNKAFVKENLKTKDGETFHAVTLPKGVIIDGVDRGLYRFMTINSTITTGCFHFLLIMK